MSSEITTGAGNFQYYVVSASGKGGFGAFVCSCGTMHHLKGRKGGGCTLSDNVWEKRGVFKTTYARELKQKPSESQQDYLS